MASVASILIHSPLETLLYPRYDLDDSSLMSWHFSLFLQPYLECENIYLDSEDIFLYIFGSSFGDKPLPI